MKVAACEGGGGEFSMPGSPLDVGNFFSDMMYTGSNDFSSPSEDAARSSSASQKPGDSWMEPGPEGILGRERQLPMFKEEPRDDATASTWSDIPVARAPSDGEKMEAQAPIGDIVHIPGGPEDQNGTKSVRYHPLGIPCTHPAHQSVLFWFA